MNISVHMTASTCLNLVQYIIVLPSLARTFIMRRLRTLVCPIPWTQERTCTMHLYMCACSEPKLKCVLQCMTNRGLLYSVVYMYAPCMHYNDRNVCVLFMFCRCTSRPLLAMCAFCGANRKTSAILHQKTFLLLLKCRITTFQPK